MKGHSPGWELRFLAPALLPVLLKFFLPDFMGNEWVYLIGPRKIAQPGFLAHDWTMGETFAHFHLFDAVVSPLCLWLAPLQAAWAGRLLAWAALVLLLAHLARRLGTSGWGFLMGFLFWLYSGQTLSAGDWIFSGLEAKCFGYGFLVLSLTCLLAKQEGLGGACAGLAFLFHPLVGAYGFMALLAAMADGALRKDARGLRRFLGTAAPFLLVGAVVDWRLLSAGPPADPAQVNRLLALFRNPHHSNPRVFLTAEAAASLVAVYACAAAALLASPDKEAGRFLLVFLTTLQVFFLGGLAAWGLGWIAWLKFQPFRLAPLFSLLLFSLALPDFLARAFRSGRLKAWPTALACLVVGWLSYRNGIPLEALRDARRFCSQWSRFARSGAMDPDYESLARWIRERTDRASVFVAPPWDARFWLLAERAQVACFKFCPFNGHVVEWHRRLSELNGGSEPQGSGFDAAEGMRENYLSLPIRQLKKMSGEFGARYYLTLRERADLRKGFLCARGPYYLYDLELL